MTDVALSMEHVYKRFRKGELYDSLRDLIPALTGQLFRRTELSQEDNRDFWALQDISFDVLAGEAFGIIGHNGAGKSTMLKLLAGIMRPTKGKMFVNGRLSAIIEIAAGFHPDLTGRENIYLNGTILGMTRREISSKLDTIIEFSGLEEFIDTPVKRYSSGMYARLGFSVSAHVDPEVLIVDEVLSVGDFVFQQKCINRMLEVIKGGATVIFVSHNLRAVEDLCTRSLLLDHGRVIGIGDTSSIVGQYMEKVMAIPTRDMTAKVAIQEVLVDGSPSWGQHFEVGQTVNVRVKTQATAPVRDIAVVLWIKNEDQYEIFNTSTERMGRPAYSLEQGQVLECEFELDLDMAYGTYQFCVAVHRYTEDKTLDSWVPASSFYVGTFQDRYRGLVPAEPRLVDEKIYQYQP